MSQTCAFVEFGTISGNHYVYDDETGMVFPGSPLLVALLRAHADRPLEVAVRDLESSYPTEELSEASAFVGHWESRFGAFYRSDSNREAKKALMLGVTPDAVRQAVGEHGFRQLILTLTENCNLRCGYCCYSPVYPLTRNRSVNSMTFDTGRRGIDFFYSQAHRHIARNPWRTIGIGFYGGEPLLEQEVMRELTNYALSQAPCPLAFTVTTNGTLLHGDILEFLVRHNFSIMVSLDGDAAQHDRHRVFADGHGSHAEVERNLVEFRERYPAYANIRLTSVLDWNADLAKLDEFFARSVGSLPSLGRVSFVSPNGTTFFDGLTKDDRLRFLSDIREQELLYMQDRLEDRAPSPLRCALFDDPLFTTMDRKRHGNQPHPFLPFTAPCLPGTKLHIQVDGTLQVCEKVNGTWTIGHIDGGLDFVKVAELVREYNRVVCDRCSSCTISRLCSLCFAACEADRTFKQSPEECMRLQQRTVETLRKLYSVLEVDPGAFRQEVTSDEAARKVAMM